MKKTVKFHFRLHQSLKITFLSALVFRLLVSVAGFTAILFDRAQFRMANCGPFLTVLLEQPGKWPVLWGDVICFSFYFLLLLYSVFAGCHFFIFFSCGVYVNILFTLLSNTLPNDTPQFAWTSFFRFLFWSTFFPLNKIYRLGESVRFFYVLFFPVKW